jgi:hypothetical protein
VQSLSNFNVLGSPPHTDDSVAQVFLVYAAENGADFCRKVTKGTTAATVAALRQLLTQAHVTYWECPCQWSTSEGAEVAFSRTAEACDNYLLVLSPQSLTDTLCLQGLLFALSMNKRIVPLLAETVALEHLPEPLQTLEIVDLRAITPPLDQKPVGCHLLNILRHDADYHQVHTQLLLQALRWERGRRAPALLLQGGDLDWYRRWLDAGMMRSHYRPIYLQTLYVAESARHWAAQGNPGAQGRGWLKRLL